MKVAEAASRSLPNWIFIHQKPFNVSESSKASNRRDLPRCQSHPGAHTHHSTRYLPSSHQTRTRTPTKDYHHNKKTRFLCFHKGQSKCLSVLHLGSILLCLAIHCHSHWYQYCCHRRRGHRPRNPQRRPLLHYMLKKINLGRNLPGKENQRVMVGKDSISLQTTEDNLHTLQGYHNCQKTKSDNLLRRLIVVLACDN